MIIKLFLMDKIVSFQLPSIISGSYSFDYEDVESKLINIEERNGIWTLYSTSDSKIVLNDNYVDSVEVFDFSFYILNRDGKNYIIYIHSVANAVTSVYDYKDLNLIIGNSVDCNVKYNCQFLNEKIFLNKKDNSFILNKSENDLVYVNNISLLNKSNIINIGDEIEIFGLKILILQEFILISRVPNLEIDVANCSLSTHIFQNSEQLIDADIKDKQLYDKKDYFSKSPVLRRNIEYKEYVLTPPPAGEKEEELPLILTIGPMMTMGIMSMTTLLNTVLKLSDGSTTLKNSWPSLVSCLAMLLSMILWPSISRWYNKKMKKRNREILVKKYNNYLGEKRKILEHEAKQQQVILTENLISLDDCLNILNRKSIGFWNKRIDQHDFLCVRIGVGDEKLQLRLNYNEEDFAIDESELKTKANELSNDFKYIKNVPLGYSLYENITTAIMGPLDKCTTFVNNIILQLITFYSYEDLKIVIFSNKNRYKNWEYLRYLNHTFDNERKFRFFATNFESTKAVADFLNVESMNRKNNPSSSEVNDVKPHYLIIIDGCDNIKKYEFIKTITETKENIGFSLLLIENRLSKLPSKCNNFISIGVNNSTLLKNSFESQEQIIFKEELNDRIDMMALTKRLSNIPIEFEKGYKALPNSISFLEMEKVGKVEQLNILNRWNINDSTQSLKAEIGVDEQGNLMYLDLHEKFHGPHGLIAGMTGSGKSEFIITYILSMCINYSPDDISFILIDYKGGGLAGAFENKVTGVVLPHLAGTITNLDKAEMDRTLVSIDSEVKKRQQKFNEARDLLGESTIDIYKYQKFYKEGKLNEPIPHLFIICDEFAELKAQQPDFMDSLISIARIGRSLGVHLILATQKPSGVVNDQIWSNTKFRVCLKVQDEADSKEMLKRPEAAHLRQAGRYYLQVGYDEVFALGQSGFCGAKYYPSERIVKQPDRSINFINDCGNFIKSIQASSGIKIKPQGEQLSAVMNTIIDVANKSNKRVKRLWLDNIPPIILLDGIIKRYNINFDDDVKAVIGEYDAPEIQTQGAVVYDYLENGNTGIYSTDGSEREMVLNSIIYSTTKNYSSEDINFYIVDYGSEFMRIYKKLPHIGGIVLQEDKEKFNNLFKMIKDEIDRRKKLFADFGGDFKVYNANSQKKEPIICVMMNNYDSIYDSNESLFDIMPELVRDSERYGIVFIISANKLNSLNSRVSQNFQNSYILTLKDKAEYRFAFGTKTNIIPREIAGRGLFKNDGIHEFQTGCIIENQEELNKFLSDYIKEQRNKNKTNAKRIPVLPEIVTFDDVKYKFKNLSTVPIGICKTDLDVQCFDLKTNLTNLVISNRISYTTKFIKSLLMELKLIKNYNIIVIDSEEILNLDKNVFNNYYNNSFNDVINNVSNFIDDLLKNNKDSFGIIIFNGIERLLNKLDSKESFTNLIHMLKKYEKYNILICETASKLKSYSFEEWYKLITNEVSGIYIGNGVSEQSILKITTYSREMTQQIPDNMGYYISDSTGKLCKIIDFISKEE